MKANYSNEFDENKTIRMKVLITKSSVIEFTIFFLSLHANILFALFSLDIHPARPVLCFNYHRTKTTTKRAGRRRMHTKARAALILEC